VQVLVDGTAYDPRVLQPVIGELRGTGFDIGLHTQAWMFTNYVAAFRKDLDTFVDVFGFAPRTFTLHGAWPRSDNDLKRRREFVARVDELIKGTGLLGYREHFDWVSEDSNILGQQVPLRDRFFRAGDLCLLGGVALILTHDNHWKCE
jgi:hypothetical protein